MEFELGLKDPFQMEITSKKLEGNSYYPYFTIKLTLQSNQELAIRLLDLCENGEVENPCRGTPLNQQQWVFPQFYFFRMKQEKLL